jgi:hypothetical protein
VAHAAGLRDEEIHGEPFSPQPSKGSSSSDVVARRMHVTQQQQIKAITACISNQARRSIEANPALF